MDSSNSPVWTSYYGKTFGNLKVLERDFSKSSKNIYFFCECQCEAKVRKSIRKNSLDLGITKSCGCLTKELKKKSQKPRLNPQRPHLTELNKQRMEQIRKQEIGKTYNSLTIIEIDREFCVCVCKCGNKKRTRRASVKNGHTTSCGCERTTRIRKNRKDGNKFESWVGRKFTYLTVTKDLHHFRAEVRCDCGVIKEINKVYLKRDEIKSCGCKRDDMRMETNLARYGSSTVSVSTSRAEQEIAAWIRGLGLNATKAYVDPTLKRGRQEIDVYVEEKKIGIEHNGLKWHTEDALNSVGRLKSKRKTNVGRWYHWEKSRLAKERGIRLIHIWDFEWKNRKDAVKSYLRSALGLNERKVGVRKIEFRKLDSKAGRDFLNAYHIQGAVNGTHVGLFLKDELLAVATFGPHHRDARKKVMSRWCVKENVTISGAISRLMKNLKNIIPIDADEILTWADLRLSDGNGYKASGWEFVSALDPEYFYYNFNSKQIASKQSRRKSVVNTPQGMTELEHAKLDGFSRIWDCGKICFRYRI